MYQPFAALVDRVNQNSQCDEPRDDPSERIPPVRNCEESERGHGGESSVEVVAVDWIAVAVFICVGRSVSNGVGLEEASGGGVVEADTHEDGAGGCVTGALLAPEPAV